MTQAILEALQASLHQDLWAFMPELVLCAGIVVMLLLRVLRVLERDHMGWLALVFTVGALGLAGLQWHNFELDYIPPGSGVDPQHSVDLFGGMLILDKFSIFVKIFLFLFTALLILLNLLTRIPDREDSADFFSLVLGATVGMSIMASANHLLMVFMGIEMASVPSYALAGFLKGRRQSSEAALKYVVYGGGAAGIMLYGISLVAGKFGTGYLPDVLFYMASTSSPTGSPTDPVVLLGLLFILVGVAFKLAAVPFHFWCPDVFEGAAAEVAAYLSVASKGAAIALLARIALGLDIGVFTIAPFMIIVLSIMAAVTTTFGNLAAYAQTNLKRLLAYSTIAHAGFMMMGLATMTAEGAGAVLFYLAVYLLMNLGAFAVVAFLRNATGSEDLRDFRGLVQRSPVMVVTLAVFLLSLLGMPPLAGFAAKFQIFAVLFETAAHHGAANRQGLSYTLYALLVIGGLNTVLSLFYYVKVLKVMTIDQPLDEVEGRPPEPLATPVGQNVYATALALLVLALGVFWNPLSRVTGVDEGAETFQRTAQVRPAQGER